MKGILKKIIGLCSVSVIASTTLLTSFPQNVKAESIVQELKSAKNEKKTGTLKYNDEDGKKKQPVRYYYDDDYFTKSAFEYNPQLASMTMCFAMSCFADNTNGYENQTSNVRKLLNELEYTDVKANDSYSKKPTTDSIGVIAAHKTIVEDGTEVPVIAVGIRGSGYESEWASNFTVGDDSDAIANGQHRGFTEASNQVVSFLKDYVAEYGLTGKVKIWITGYSRAAATTNLTAAALDRNSSILENVSVSSKDVFAYCFETPAGAYSTALTENPKQYYNIFNIINPNDLVPKVAPATMNFRRYGVDMVLPSVSTDANYLKNKVKMVEYYEAMSGEKYLIDTFKPKDWDFDYDFNTNVIKVFDDPYGTTLQDVLLDEMFAKLSNKIFKDRANYKAQFQEGLRDILELYFGSGKNSDKFVKELKNQVTVIKAINIYANLQLGFSNKGIFEDILEESISKANLKATEQQISDMANTLDKLLSGVFNNVMSQAISIGYNSTAVVSGHLPELCMAWLETMDTNYTEDAETTFTTGEYRVVKLSGEVSVNVYRKSTKELLAKFTPDNKIIKNNADYLGASINPDEEKVVYIPMNDDYYLEVYNDSDDSNYKITISEFSPTIGNYTYVKHYKNIDVSKGQISTVDIPMIYRTYGEEADGETDGADYDLSIDGKTNNDYELFLGFYDANQYFDVDVSTDDNDLGYVKGDNFVLYGSQAVVEATPKENGEFVGWYIGDKCVSKDTKYALGVYSDVEIKGKFEAKKTEFNISVKDSEHGVVKANKDVAKAGDDISLTVTPEDGYVLSEIIVNGEKIDGTIFKMPEKDTVISATFTKKTAKDPSNGGNVETGDTVFSMMWIVLISLGMCGIGFAFMTRRKRQ